MAVNLLSWVDFFKRRKPQKGGLGVATPTRFPQDKMSRKAKFGTVVESCSKKVAASSVWAFADTPGLLGVDSANYAAVFLPLLLTTHGKANLAKFPRISFRVFTTAFDKNGKLEAFLGLKSVPFCSDIRTVSKNAKLSGNYFSPYYLLREKRKFRQCFQKVVELFYYGAKSGLVLGAKKQETFS